MMNTQSPKPLKAVEKKNSNLPPNTPRPNVTPVAQGGTTSVPCWPIKCPACEGKGEVEHFAGCEYMGYHHMVTCKACVGKGILMVRCDGLSHCAASKKQ